MQTGVVATAKYYYALEGTKLAIADRPGVKVKDTDKMKLEYDPHVWQHVKFMQVPNWHNTDELKQSLTTPAIRVLDDVITSLTTQVAGRGGGNYYTVWAPEGVTPIGLENALRRNGIRAQVRDEGEL